MAEVVLFHHAQGLTPGVIGFAEILRRSGHTVHVPDLYEAEPRRIEALVPLDGARILEIGCGDGRLTGFAAARAASVYAFDPDGEQVAAARAAVAAQSVFARG